VRYRTAAIAGGALLGIVVIALIVMLVVSWFRPSGVLLTITRPANGTITASGIRCGTRGNDCTANRPKDEAVELSPEPDAGFTFVGYTGDCAPGGRTVMSTARTCGAAFEPITVAAASTTRSLTINPIPTGGTVEGIDILCGTKGTACQANHPENVLVDLIATADQGFTFMGFQGDCAPLGKTQMTGPRTCSASFQRASLVANPPPPPPPPITRGGRTGGTGTSTGSATPAPSGTTAGGGQVRGSANQPPPTTTPSHPPSGGDPPPIGPPGDVKEVVTPEQFAKNQIQTLLKEYCVAHEELNPEGVQRTYPTVNMQALRNQLNKSQYKSVRCSVADPIKFDILDAAGGKAQIEADVTRVYEHTVDKPRTDEQIATMMLSRPSGRGTWQIDSAKYRPKPKK
jgi:hypothetical protein